MANEEHHRGEDDEEQFQALFGERANISHELRNIVGRIRNNDPQMKRLTTVHFDDNEVRVITNELSDLAWEVLGRYIANNTHFEEIDLDSNDMTDDKVTSLFRGLTKSSSMEVLDLMDNTFGVNGIRSMIPFLKSSPNLSTLRMSSNSAIGTEGFELAIQTLNGSAMMNELHFSGCNIEDVSSLETYPLSNLRELSLSHNTVGREGFIIIANLLQKEDSTLIRLYLNTTGMGDDEAEIIATSLKHNNMLQTLYMSGNNIREKGKGAFLKMLTDVLSIENTYNSNHTLTEIFLQDDDEDEDEEDVKEANPIQREIDITCNLNSGSSSPKTAGRAKVIHSHLNNQRRKSYCQIQGIEYSSSDNLFADMEPALLPKVLELIGNNHGQSEFYTALVIMIPDLMAYIDTKAIIKDMIANHKAQIAALTERLAIMESEDSKQLLVEDEGSNGTGKRERSASLLSLGDIVEKRKRDTKTFQNSRYT